MTELKKERKEHCQKKEIVQDEGGKRRENKKNTLSHTHTLLLNYTRNPLTPLYKHTSSSGGLGLSPSGEGFVSDSGEALARVG